VSEPGEGNRPTSADLRWVEAAKELTPDKSLLRATANAKFLVATISVLGVLITGFGAVSATQVASEKALLIGTGLTTVLAALSVGIAIWTLLPRNDKIRAGNLIAVREWYQAELKRKGKASVAGLLLLVAIAVAAGTAVAGTIAAIVNKAPTNHVTVSAAKTKDGYIIAVKGTVSNVPAGSIVNLTLSGPDRLVVVVAKPDEEETATVDSTAVVASLPAKLSTSIRVVGPDGHLLDEFLWQSP
jgi:hypothetical protein